MKLKPLKKSEDEIARKVTQHKGLLRRDNVPEEDYCMPAEKLAELLGHEQTEKTRWFGDEDYVVVDKGPVPLQFKLGVTTKDGHKLEGDLTVTYQLNTVSAVGKLIRTLVSLFATEGKTAVLKSDLEGILAPKLSEAATSVAGTFTANDICSDMSGRADFYSCLKSELNLAEYGLGASDIVCKWSGRFLDIVEQRAAIDIEAGLESAEAESAKTALRDQLGLLELKRNILEARSGMQEELLKIERIRVEAVTAQRKAEQELDSEKSREEQRLTLERQKEENEIYLRRRREESSIDSEKVERESAAKVLEYKEKIAALEKEVQIREKEVTLAGQLRLQPAIVQQNDLDLNKSLQDLVSVLNKLLGSQGLKKIISSELPEIEEKVENYERKAGQPLPDIYLKLGNMAYCKGSFQQAINWYNKLLRTDKNNAVVWNNLGAAFDAIGSKDDALECYNKAMALRSEFAEAINNKAVLLYSMGQASSAFELLRGTKSRSGLILYNLAMAEIKVGDLNSAKQHLENILRSGNVNLNTLVALGDVHSAMGNFDRAQTFYIKALKIDPKNKTVWLNRLDAFRKAGMISEAESCAAVLTRPSCANIAQIVYSKA